MKLGIEIHFPYIKTIFPIRKNFLFHKNLLQVNVFVHLAANKYAIIFL